MVSPRVLSSLGETILRSSPHVTDIGSACGYRLGVKRASREVLDGLDAVSEYRRYRRLPAASPKKAALREELIAYNRDDLRGLVRVVERLKEFTHTGKT